MLKAQTAGSKEEISIFCPLVKVDVAKREVWGVVTAEEPDKEGEICDFETTAPYYKDVVAEMSKATDGANIFPLRAMHGLIAAGKGISIEFRKEAKEIYMGFKVVDDAEWKKVQENVYTGFSQGGRYMKRWKDGEFMRYTAKPGEVSLVDMPCCTRAHFDYIKADGTVEMRKFSKSDEKEIATRKVTGCNCPCTECDEGKCSMCSSATKCPCGKAGHVDNTKYLVTEKSGTNHLPYTNAEGKLSYRKMMKAWYALHDHHIEKRYEGPDKNAAVKKLKQLYAKEGTDTPAEKSVLIEQVVKGWIEEAIQNRAYGMLGKGMYTVSRFAQLTEDIKYLWLSMEYEREQEGDDSPVTDDVRDVYLSFLDHLLAYTEEQVEEAKEHQYSTL